MFVRFALFFLASSIMFAANAQPQPTPQPLKVRPVTRPNLPPKPSDYKVLASDPIARVVTPGMLEVTFETREPTPLAMLHYGINTLDEELDYPRFRASAEEKGETSNLRTTHSIKADFRKVTEYAHNTPFEPRVTWRIEVYIPKLKSTRFVEGRTYFDPATYGDATNVVAGPYVADITTESATIAWETDRTTTGAVTVDGRTYASDGETSRHSVTINGLEAGREYTYKLATGSTRVRPYSFRTEAVNAPFTFAAMVDSREGFGGGESSFYGVEARALSALIQDAYFRGARFVIFGGDLVNGYLTDEGDFRRQIDAFRYVIGPVWARLPMYTGIGNHEALLDTFENGSQFGLSVDRLSGPNVETVFADMLYNPTNGPESEGEFTPTYKENVYHVDYGNTRVFLINTNYWYSADVPKQGGNIIGYLLPKQLEWIREEVKRTDADPNIEHVFFMGHVPVFPNGGHAASSMWYNGGDTNRDKKVDGKDYDILGSRNTFWEIMSGSPKTVAYIAGDEHSYNRLIVTPDMQVGSKRKLDGSNAEFKHTVWQITSGGAGAPWYDKDLTFPWSKNLQKHSTQPHCAYFTVDGANVKLDVYGQTGQKLDESVLRTQSKNAQ